MYAAASEYMDTFTFNYPIQLRHLMFSEQHIDRATITLAEVAGHNKADSLHVVIDHDVFDLT